MHSVGSRDKKSGLTTLFVAGLLAASVGVVGCGDDDGTAGGGGGGAGGGGAGGGDAGTPEDLLVDTDIALVRLNADGTLDTTFGMGGIALVDFGAGYDSDGDGLVNHRDALSSAALDADGNIVLFGTMKGANGSSLRVDNDRVTARVLPNGTLDDTFGTPVDSGAPLGPKTGMHVLNIGGLNDNVRNGSVLGDGSILAAGYTNQPTGVGAEGQNRIVLLKLTNDGVPDATWGSGFGIERSGIVNFDPFTPDDPINEPWGMAEAYAAGVQSSGRTVTVGYGRSASSGSVNLVSSGFDEEGDYDPTYSNDGNDTFDGTFEMVTEPAANDRGRNLLVLPDDRIVAVGSANGDADSRIVMLTEDGALDTTFDTDGYWIHDFGFDSEPLYGVAYEADDDLLAACGYRAYPNGAVDPEDDDATLVIMDPASPGDAITSVQAFSADGDDRCWSVTFDAAGNVLVAGFAVVDGDSHMVVARYTQAGALDTTFGDDGIVLFNVTNLADLPVGGTFEEARRVLVQNDGKLIVAGTTEVVLAL
jgi:uncharacterized delta-60 repeat protein